MFICCTESFRGLKSLYTVLMHKNGIRKVTLCRLCFGAYPTVVRFIRYRYRCPNCSHTEIKNILFKAGGHNITGELLQFTKNLLIYGFTNK